MKNSNTICYFHIDSDKTRRTFIISFDIRHCMILSSHSKIPSSREDKSIIVKLAGIMHKDTIIVRILLANYRPILPSRNIIRRKEDVFSAKVIILA
jgi:hypothetical protein